MKKTENRENVEFPNNEEFEATEEPMVAEPIDVDGQIRDAMATINKEVVRMSNYLKSIEKKLATATSWEEEHKLLVPVLNGLETLCKDPKNLVLNPVPDPVV